MISAGASISIDAGPDRIAVEGDMINLSAQAAEPVIGTMDGVRPSACRPASQTLPADRKSNRGRWLDSEDVRIPMPWEVITETTESPWCSPPNNFTPQQRRINDVFRSMAMTRWCGYATGGV